MNDDTLKDHKILVITLPIPLVLFPLDEAGIEYWAELAARSARQQLRRGTP